MAAPDTTSPSLPTEPPHEPPPPDPPMPAVLAETFPSVDLAYEFVRPSYEHIGRRFEAIEGRVRSILTLAASVTFAVPAFAISLYGRDAVDVRSPWLFAAGASFLALVVVFVWASLAQRVRWFDLAQLRREYLDCPPWEFRYNVLYWAAEHLESNTWRLTAHGRRADAMAFLLMLELVCLTAWVLAG